MRVLVVFLVILAFIAGANAGPAPVSACAAVRVGGDCITDLVTSDPPPAQKPPGRFPYFYPYCATLYVCDIPPAPPARVADTHTALIATPVIVPPSR